MGGRSWACRRASACARRNGNVCTVTRGGSGEVAPPLPLLSGVADSAGLSGRDADSPQLSAASANSLRRHERSPPRMR